MEIYRPLLQNLLREVVWVRPLLDMYHVYPTTPKAKPKAANRPLGGLLMECLTTLSRSKDSDASMWAEKLGLHGLMDLCGDHHFQRADRPPPNTPPPSLLRLPSERRVQSLLHRRPKAGNPGFHAYNEPIFLLRELFRVSGVPHSGRRGQQFYWSELSKLVSNKTLWALADYFWFLSHCVQNQGPGFFLSHDLSKGAMSKIDAFIWPFLDLDKERLRQVARKGVARGSITDVRKHEAAVRDWKQRLTDLGKFSNPFDFSKVLLGLASMASPLRLQSVKLPPDDFLWSCFEEVPPRPLTAKGTNLRYDRFKRRMSEVEREKLLRILRTLSSNPQTP